MDSPFPPDSSYLQREPCVKRVVLEVLRPPYPLDKIRKDLDAVFQELGFVPNNGEKITKNNTGGIPFEYVKFGGDSVTKAEILARLNFFRTLSSFTLNFS